MKEWVEVSGQRGHRLDVRGGKIQVRLNACNCSYWLHTRGTCLAFLFCCGTLDLPAKTVPKQIYCISAIVYSDLEIHCLQS